MEGTYEIFTDASFDDCTKLATYSVVIIKNKKLQKAFAKKAKTEMFGSTECEIFAIFQAMLIIENNIIQDQKVKKIYLSTDSSATKNFFKGKTKTKIFKKNLKLCNEIKTTYGRINNKMKEKNIDFELRHISREKNKIAHRYSYETFKNCKKEDPKNDIMKKKNELAQFYEKIGLKMGKVLIYLFLISNEERNILKTQNEIAKALSISSTKVNRIFYKLRELKILEKKGNGRYFLML